MNIPEDLISGLGHRKDLFEMCKHKFLSRSFLSRTYVQLIEVRLVDSNGVSDTILDLNRRNDKPCNCSNIRLEYNA
jgi:hypothetical protein